MGEVEVDLGGGQVSAIANFLVGSVVYAMEMVVFFSHVLDGQVDGDVCDGVVGLGEHQHRSIFSMGR